MKYKLMFLTSAIIAVFAVALYSAEEFNTKKADELYKKHCSKCHRNNGEGIKKVYPPVKNADYIKNATTDELLRGMLFGRSGKIVVNGVSYNGVMTTEIDGSVSDTDIALLLTYIYRNFNGMDKTVTADDVKKARKAGKLPPHK